MHIYICESNIIVICPSDVCTGLAQLLARNCRKLNNFKKIDASFMIIHQPTCSNLTRLTKIFQTTLTTHSQTLKTHVPHNVR
jgi:altronate dehydratase